jgi:hypothetical protein
VGTYVISSSRMCTFASGGSDAAVLIENLGNKLLSNMGTVVRFIGKFIE